MAVSYIREQEEWQAGYVLLYQVVPLTYQVALRFDQL